MRRRYPGTILLSLAIMMVIFVFSSNGLQAQETAETWLKMARQYGKDGYIGLAAKAYSNVIALDSKNIEAYFSRGRIYSLLTLHDKALADFDKSIALDKTFAKGYHGRGIIYEKQGKINKAIEAYSSAIKYDPESGISYFCRGYCYNLKERYEKAIADLNKDIKLRPNNVMSYFYRGHSLSRRGDYNSAIKDYMTVLTFERDDFVTLNNMADCYLKSGQPEAGLHYLATALKKAPSEPILYMTLGELFEAQKRTTDALEAYQRCRELASANKDNNWLVKEADKKIEELGKKQQKS